MTDYELETIREELAYWEDDSIEDRLDVELCRVMRLYEPCDPELWQLATEGF